ncbi:PTS system sorbose-specific EIIC component [bioreactor metagenome]|uniref:PTS system sorbose-specific EIIC component n=1 Tax=bioreactor metagenome TaxID=1076179 RepID=A0A645C7T3_9ZZZZ|nr:PTS sugar transporter subunit IIC [Erysipelotrichaceae bacterium]
MTTFQALFLLVLTCIAGYDAYGMQLQFFTSKVVIGFLLGLVFGDVKTGLYLGGTLQLMSMGVVGLAGASVPNYTVATLVAVPIAVAAGGSVEAGLAIGIPVAMLYVQLDIIHKILNGFVARWSQNYCNKKEFGKMNSILWLGTVMQVLTYLIPVAISVFIGVSAINDILAVLPDWFMGGLKVAGKILPVVGIAMLLNYMPAKKYINYLIIGFVLYAYLNVKMLGVALVGFALAFKFFKDELYKSKHTGAAAVNGGVSGDE